MSHSSTNKGPLKHRVLVMLFTGVLTTLVYWLLGFLMQDIDRWPGPVYAELEERLLDANLVTQSETFQERITETERQITDQHVRQEILRDSTGNSQRTMNQLLQIQRLALQKGVTPTPQEQQALAESEQLFLANQKQYQGLNEQVARLNEQLRDLREQQRELEKRLDEEREPIVEKYDELLSDHRWKMAAVKLAALLPLLAVGVLLFLTKRRSPYAPLVYAFGIAVAIKVGMVMHEYFPTRYFKYVLIAAALVIVVQILIQLLRMVAFPKRDWLLKQYREAYETFLCPVCSYPIRRGPLRYMFWSRRSIKKLPFPASSVEADDTAYTCPLCATKLYEECDSCHAIRHSLLPACEKCGAEKPLPTVIAGNGADATSASEQGASP